MDPANAQFSPAEMAGTAREGGNPRPGGFSPLSAEAPGCRAGAEELRRLRESEARWRQILLVELEAATQRCHALQAAVSSLQKELVCWAQRDQLVRAELAASAQKSAGLSRENEVLRRAAERVEEGVAARPDRREPCPPREAAPGDPIAGQRLPPVPDAERLRSALFVLRREVGVLRAEKSNLLGRERSLRAERDALQRERDALQRERDALQRERGPADPRPALGPREAAEGCGPPGAPPLKKRRVERQARAVLLRCARCDQTFARPGMFTRHQAIRPDCKGLGARCEQCGETFGALDDWSRHWQLICYPGSAGVARSKPEAAVPAADSSSERGGPASADPAADWSPEIDWDE